MCASRCPRAKIHRPSRMPPRGLRPSQALHLSQALAKALEDAPKQVPEIGAATPRESLQQLRAALRGKPEDRRLWAQKAKIAAILGACPKSQKSLISGLRHWCEFVAIAYGDESKVSVARILCLGSVFCILGHAVYAGFPSTNGHGPCMEHHIQMRRHIWQLPRLFAHSLPCLGL